MRRQLASTALALSLGLLPSLAGASAPPAPSECIVENGVAAFDIPTNPAVMTALHFPGQYKASSVADE